MGTYAAVAAGNFSYIYNDKQDLKQPCLYLNQYKELNLQYLGKKADEVP